MKANTKLIFLTVSLVLLSIFSACSPKDDKAEPLTSLSISGKTVKCHDDMAEILKLFSDKEYEYSESISCEYDGLDKIYEYGSFSIYTYPKQDKDYVYEVVLLDDTNVQQGKIKVGMKKDEVIAMFGNDFVMEGVNMTYKIKDSDQSYYFVIEEDTVAEIGITIAK